MPSESLRRFGRKYRLSFELLFPFGVSGCVLSSDDGGVSLFVFGLLKLFFLNDSLLNCAGKLFGDASTPLIIVNVAAVPNAIRATIMTIFAVILFDLSM